MMKLKGILICALIILIFLSSGCITKPSTDLDNTTESDITKEPYTEPNPYSDFFCTIDGEKYTLEEFYALSPMMHKEQLTYCFCYPKEDKNKFAIIMKENSKLYSGELENEIQDYFDAINSDLGIENVGILFVDGSNLEENVHDLYLNQDVGYVLLVGKDLLLAATGLNRQGELSFVPQRYQVSLGEARCPSVAVSALVAPNYESIARKRGFIVDELKKYTKFHNNPREHLNKFSRSYIRIVNLDVTSKYPSFDPSSPDIKEDIKYRWDLPKRDILRSDSNLKAEIKGERPVILEIMGHGWSRILYWGGDNTTDSWIDFTKDFTPSILIINNGCGGMIVDDFGKPMFGTAGAEFCCWPQAALSSGSLAYISGTMIRIFDLTGSDFFAQALRKHHFSVKYFGDPFAYIL